MELHKTIMLWMTSIALVLAGIAFFGAGRLETRRLQIFLLFGLALVALMLTLGADRGGLMVYRYATGVQRPPAPPPASQTAPATPPSPQQHPHQH